MLRTRQKIDKELETALANLDREKEEALKDLDAQVCCYQLSTMPKSWMEWLLLRVDVCVQCASCHITKPVYSRWIYVQVGKLSGEILARVLPEGVKL